MKNGVKSKVVPEGWAVTITAQPSGTTLVLMSQFINMTENSFSSAIINKSYRLTQLDLII